MSWREPENLSTPVGNVVNLHERHAVCSGLTHAICFGMTYSTYPEYSRRLVGLLTPLKTDYSRRSSEICNLVKLGNLYDSRHSTAGQDSKTNEEFFDLMKSGKL